MRPWLVLASLLLAACDPLGTSPPADEEAAVRRAAEAPVGSPPEDQASVATRLGLDWVPRRPYRVGVRVAFVDFPSGSAETVSLVDGLSSGLSSHWGERVDFDVRPVDAGWADPLLAVSDFWEIPEDLRRDVDGDAPDRIVLLRFARTGVRTVLTLREIDPRHGFVSAIGSESSASLGDLYHAARQRFDDLLSQEGHLLEQAATGEWSILFRAGGIEAGALGLAPSALFEVHRRVLDGSGSVSYPRIPGGWFRLERIGFTAGRLEASGRVLGSAQPAPGDLIRRAFLPGGTRAIELVDPEGRGVEGASLFASRGSFSSEPDAYVGLSDAGGRAEFSTPAGQLAFLTVMRTIQGTPYVFHRRIAGTGEGLPPLRVVLPRIDRELRAKAGELADRRVSHEELQNRKRRASMYLAEAEIYIRQGEYRPAQDALQRGIEALEALPDAEVADLRKTLLDLAGRFGERVIRQEELASLEEAKELVAQADRAVLAGEFDVAVRLLERAASIWPRRAFPEAGGDVDAPPDRARALSAGAATPLGRARRTLLVRTPRLDPDTLDDEFIQEAGSAIATLFREGVLDASIVYGDLEILQYARRNLDELANRLGDRAVRAMHDYEAATDLVLRQKAYDLHRRFLDRSRRLDELLKAFPRATGKKE